jgi:hypothetical protein
MKFLGEHHVKSADLARACWQHFSRFSAAYNIFTAINQATFRTMTVFMYPLRTISKASAIRAFFSHIIRS